MELPSTSPSGRNPASRTSRNSLTDRSEVKIAPGLPGCSSARRLSASSGTPAALSSVLVWSVIVLLGSTWLRPGLRGQPDPGSLAPLRVERQDRQAGPLRRPRRRAEAGDGGANRGGLDDVVAPAFLDRALLLAHHQVHALHHNTAGTHPGHVAF